MHSVSAHAPYSFTFRLLLGSEWLQHGCAVCSATSC